MPVLITRIASIGTITALALGLVAVAIKGGGTTARINEIGYLFGPSFVFALVLLIMGPRTQISSALMMLVASILGFVLPFYLQATGALVDYEMMLHGEQVPSDHPIAWLALYAGVCAVALFGSREGSRRLRPQGG